jgi:hypothetical protein
VIGSASLLPLWKTTSGEPSLSPSPKGQRRRGTASRLHATRRVGCQMAACRTSSSKLKAYRDLRRAIDSSGYLGRRDRRGSAGVGGWMCYSRARASTQRCAAAAGPCCFRALGRLGAQLTCRRAAGGRCRQLVRICRKWVVRRRKCPNSPGRPPLLGGLGSDLRRDPGDARPRGNWARPLWHRPESW